MEIEDLNDFLVEYTTGLTKEQVAQDAAIIKQRREEVATLEEKLELLNTEIPIEQAKYNDFIKVNKELRTKQDKVKSEVAYKEAKFKLLAEELPLLEAEVEAYKDALVDHKQTWNTIENRIKKAEQLENKNIAEQAKITQDIQRAEELERKNHLDTIKANKMIATNANMVRLADAVKRDRRVSKQIA